MTMPDATYWNACIRAFLHDPPDKALDIRTHEERAVRYQAATLNVPVEEARARAQQQGDWLASALERLPLPSGRLDIPCNRLNRHELRRTHPVSGGDITNTTVGLSQAQDITGATVDARAARLRDLCQAQPDERRRAYALWRFLPTILPKVCDLPGDTRLTDHSIVDHLDACAAATSALVDGEAALLTCSLGPVQDFITQARSARDLWTGSYLIAWLTFHAMVPVIEACGPWCIVSPGLRGNPFLDWWLERQGVRQADGQVVQADRAALRCASLPNVFTTIVPAAQGDALRAAVRAAVEREWQSIAHAVHGALTEAWSQLPTWDAHWTEQCREVWDLRTVVMPFATATSSDAIRISADRLRASYQQLLGEFPQSVVDATTIAESLDAAGQLPGYARSQGLWMLANELAQKVLDADKRCRRIPAHADPHDTREKCALMPGFAVMGPLGDTAANKTWWRQAAQQAPRLPGKLSATERLSAPGLIKRFAFGAYFRSILGHDRFPDTRESALAAWLSDFRTRYREDGKATGRLHWDNFVKVVNGINRRTNSELEEPWTAYELLDESRLDPQQWLHPAADPVTLRAGLARATQARRSLIARAATIGLPAPPVYYAVLVADGDRMGEFLSGFRGPTFRQSYHPTVIDHLRSLARPVPTDLLDRVRPLGPAAQIALSGCLANFTIQATHEIGGAGHGTVIYAGGDDLLAIIPVTTCLSTAEQVAQAFTRYVAGATISAGIAVVHVHEDLRVAIQEARQAEATAKRLGRDGCCLRIVRRSGETTEAFSPWSGQAQQRLVSGPGRATWDGLSHTLIGCSDRWVHHLLDEVDALTVLPPEAAILRLAHLIRHSDAGDRLHPSDLQELWAGMHQGHTARAVLPHQEQVRHFAVWCQSAAWMARFHRRDMTAQMKAAP